MIKFFAFNVLVALFLSSCAHNEHKAHHAHDGTKKECGKHLGDEKSKPCKVGEKCDKKEKDCCKTDQAEKKEDCCKVKKAS